MVVELIRNFTLFGCKYSAVTPASPILPEVFAYLFTYDSIELSDKRRRLRAGMSELGLAPLRCYANILRPIITLFSADSKGNIMKTG
jgi:hypothetical protein